MRATKPLRQASLAALLAATALVPSLAMARGPGDGASRAASAAVSDPMGGPARIAGEQVISGSMFYPRIPRELWRDRLKKARAMGLNTIETYVFWNVHEKTPGHFDFTGQNDLAEFVREAGEEGLHVIVRPGPYVCAEWDWGGLPPWLNKDPDMVVRSRYPGFMKAAQRYLKAVAGQIASLQASRGGPIIGVQVENEYGSYGEDHAYMEAMRQAYLAAGFSAPLLFTADGPDLLARGSLPDLPVALNFAPNYAKGAFETLETFRPGAPIFVGEYWDGWFDHWGAHHETRDGTAQAAELEAMLKAGASVNLYMFTGGTSFGWMAGANSSGANADHTTGAKVNYQPDVTSYDYDSPLTEDGRPTAKFYAFRAAITAATGKTPPPLPAPLPRIEIPPVALGRGASLWEHLPSAHTAKAPLTMEDVGQSYGYILYETTIATAHDAPDELELPGVHDYAAVYLDGVLQGAVDRRLQQSKLKLEPIRAGAKLAILVENSGRVNYGPAIPTERAGLLGTPRLDGRDLTGWKTYPVPMTTQPAGEVGDGCEGPCFYRATFDLATRGDTFLDTRGLTKGAIWVNGHNLGRYWNVGPQRTLYLPATFLKTGRNEVVVFDLFGKSGASVEGFAEPLLDAPPQEDAASKLAY